MKTKTKKNRKFRKPTKALFGRGTIIKHPKRGIGIVVQVDDRPRPVYEFFYYVSFNGNGGDGSKVWLPKTQTEEICKVLGIDSPDCEGAGPECPVPCPGIKDCKLCKS